MMDLTSSTLERMPRLLMLRMIRMMKDKLLLSMDLRERISDRNGMSSILTKLSQSQLRDSAKNSVSISTDHSIWSQDSHSRESLNLSQPTTWSSRDGERTSWDNNSSSIPYQRQSDPSNGRTMPWKSNPMVDQPMLE